MKFLVLLRHGIAEEKTAEKADADRQLTDEGRRRMKRIARSLARLFPAAEAIYSSPLVRCVQTAEVVAKAYGLEIKTTDALRPDGVVADVRKLLPAADFAIFVGHEPNMSLVMLDLTKMRGEITLKKGGCYGIAVDGTAARLEWMLPPCVLRLR